MPRIAIFFEHKLIASRKPFSNFAFENNIAINLHAYFAVSVCRDFVKDKFWLKSLANCGLDVISFSNFIIVFLFRVVNTVGIISLPVLSNNSELTLRGSCEMGLIRLADIAPILGMGAIEKCRLCSFNPPFSIKRGDESFFTRNTLAVTKSS